MIMNYSAQDALPPTIKVSASGLITATSGGGTSSKQLLTQAGKTIIPSNISQVAIASGYYSTGDILVNPAYNFDIVGGTTQPEAKENRIWVNTDTEITGFVFSATEPVGTVGLVWICTANKGVYTLNILKNNQLFLSLVGVKQFVGGSWVSKIGKIYSSSKWITFSQLNLYLLGDECAIVTGGWESIGVRLTNNSAITAVAPSLNKYSDNMYIQSGSTVYSGGIVKTKSKINLAGYNSIKVKIKPSSNYSNGYMGFSLLTSIGTYQSDNRVCRKNISSDTSLREEVLDISAINKSINYFFAFDGIYTQNSGEYSKLTVYEVIALP